MYSAIEQHYRANYDRLVTAYSGRVGYHNAQDVVQEAYTRALVYSKALVGDRPIDHWINQIIRNCVADHYRGIVPTEPEEVALDIPDDEHFFDPERVLIAKDLLGLVARLAENRKPAHAAIIRAFYMDELTLNQTARRCKCHPGMAWAVIRQFRRELKDLGLSD